MYSISYWNRWISIAMLVYRSVSSRCFFCHPFEKYDRQRTGGSSWNSQLCCRDSPILKLPADSSCKTCPAYVFANTIGLQANSMLCCMTRPPTFLYHGWITTFFAENGYVVTFWIPMFVYLWFTPKVCAKPFLLLFGVIVRPQENFGSDPSLLKLHEKTVIQIWNRIQAFCCSVDLVLPFTHVFI